MGGGCVAKLSNVNLLYLTWQPLKRNGMFTDTPVSVYKIQQDYVDHVSYAQSYTVKASESTQQHLLKSYWDKAAII